MDDVSERFLGALSALEQVADELTSDEAAATLDEAALQLFWREWPQLGSWAGTLWRQLNEDLAGPSSAVAESELDEVGGEGGCGTAGPRRAARRGGRSWLNSPKS